MWCHEGRQKRTQKGLHHGRRGKNYGTKINRSCEGSGCFRGWVAKLQTLYSQAITKANRLLGRVRRSFQYIDRNIDIPLHIYKGLVGAILEYGHAIWNTHLRKDIELEAVLRRATEVTTKIKTPWLPRLPQSIRITHSYLSPYQRRYDQAIQIPIWTIYKVL